MTLSPDEHGDILRRVLRAEADAVVPSPEGLEIIRARIDRRGVRNLFWWRAGAAAASAVLVAGTIVMIVPELRENVVPTEILGHTESATPPPNKSSTSRPQTPKNTQRGQSPPVMVVTPDSTPPLPAETAESTKKPAPTPTPTSTPCPTAAEEPATEDCPGETPTPTPSATPTDEPTPTCPAEECPPEDPAPSVTDATPISPNGG
ncbi:hypothetical protein ACIBG8_52225 [Nonomuraea sp. NPDC050556]|uniref:hypothetical protein n=1 Tax=Nonomuraea sp. NPDC050556 TaxID=3364369 RepID=UPI003787E7E1